MKKTLKLLILLMSLALIVGALSVVAFAKDGEDDAVIVTGDIDTEGTFDDALAEIFENGDGEYTITLQGNCESEGVVLDDSVNEAREVTIDLNGYTLDLEDATTAFNVAAFNTLNVTGSGEILIGSQLVSTTTDCDSVINFIGTGAGIKITSTTEAVNKIVANGTSEINFKNVIIDVSYDVEVSGEYKPMESVVVVNDGTKVTFEDSQFVYTIDFYAGEGLVEVIASCDDTKKQNNFGMSNSRFADISGASQLVLNNTYVKTPTAGVFFFGASGMENEIAEGSYSLVMNGSTLFCANDSQATNEYNKLFGTKMSNQRMILFNFNNGDYSTGDLYIKDSYTAASYRLINSMADMAAQENPVHAIYDGSTLELLTYMDLMAGITLGHNGEGVFDNGPIYMTFKNNSAINLKVGNIRCGGSANNKLGDKLVKGTAIGSGEYCADFEIGTRSAGNLSDCDIPENTAFKANPAAGYMNVPFILMDKDADTGYSYTGRGVLSIQNDNGTVTVANIGSLDGYSNVKQIKTLSLAEIKAHAKYDPATRTLDTGKGSYVVSEDGNSFTLNAIAGNYIQYDNCYDTDKITNDDAVVVMAFHVKPDGNNPLRFWGTASNTYFWPHTRPKTGGHYWNTNNMVSTNTVTAKTPAGEWSEIAFVIDYTTGAFYTLINGEIVAEKNFGADVTGKKIYFDAMWLTYGSGTFTDTASMYLDGVQVYGFEDKYTGTFDPAEYLNIARSANAGYLTPDVANSAFTVGGQVFDDINAALAFANENNSFVNINAPVENATVSTAGIVRTNGYDFNFNSLFDYEVEDGIYTFEDVKTVNVNWYYGNAEDPTADAANMSTTQVPENSNTIIKPETTLTVNKIDTDYGIYNFAGAWVTTYVRPAAYESGEAYLEAIKNLQLITDFSGVSVGGDDVTFYPVYNFSRFAFKTYNSGGALIAVYTKNDDLTVAMAKAGSGSTVKLFDNCVVKTQYKGASMGATDTHDSFHRNGAWRWIDLNGYELLIDVPEGATWIDMAGGKVGLKSSRPGGVLAQAAQTDGAPIFNSRSNSALLQVDDPNNYVTVKAYSFLTVSRWGNNPDSSSNDYMRAPEAILNGGTYINLGNSGGNRGFIFSNMLGGYKSLTANNCTFINAGLNCMIYTTSDDVHIYNNCTFININANARHIMSQQNQDGRGQSTINFNNCAISGYNLAGYKAKVTGTTVATFLGLDMITESGKAVAYDSSVTMTWPAQLGDSYVITNDMGETLATITADVLDVKFAIYDEAAVTNYKWNGLAGGFWTANVAEGTDPAGLNDYATEWVNRSNTAALTALTVGVKTWKLEGTEFSADEKVALGLSGFGALANVKLEEGFVLGILVTPENYEFLSEESKALFTKVTLEGVDYYIASADRAVNEAFTAFTVEVTVEEDGCDYTTSYTVSVMDYLELVAAAEVREEMDKIVAYIGAYLNNAYAYFTTTDATEDDLAALAAFVAANAPEAITAPEAPEAINANGNLEIKLDLTATPAFVITSKVAGTVTFNGKTTNLVANEPVRLEASVLDFDNALTFALEGDVTGNYCLANYAATIAAATEIEGLNEEQLAALKALVASFYDYVIYAENFR